MAARLKELYTKTVLPTLTKEFSYKNTMAVPKIEKITVNIGLGEATQNAKLMDGAVNELNAIAGQRAVITKAMNICITTTARTDAEGLALLKHMGMPFRQ